MFADHSGCKSNNLEEQKYLFSLLLKVHRSKKSKNVQTLKKTIVECIRKQTLLLKKPNDYFSQSTCKTF